MLASVGSFTTIFVVVVDEAPMTIDRVMAEPPFRLAVLDAKAPEILRCSWAI